MANLNKIIFYQLFILFGLIPLVTFGYVASSTNYVLQSDSVNFGGNFSSSTSYRLEDTLGEIATGLYSSSTLIMSSGYQAMSLDVYLAINSPSNPVMSAIINGVGGGVSNGSAVWRVETDNPVGYELSIRSNSTPALTSNANSFSDYAPSYADPDFSWSTPATESRFGFSPEGDDLVSSFLDNGVSCGSGVLDTNDACWVGFSTTDKIIARSSNPNYPTGASTTVKFRAEVGNKKAQPKGTYQANIIVTVVTL